MQNILKQLDCTDDNVASAYLAGGIDTQTAESMVAAGYEVTLPRTDGDTYVSLIDECGGHTKEYHFHERLSCLYKEEGVHSTKVGQGSDDKPLHGKWEDYSTKTLPMLDACGGHFGITPDSDGKIVYHYHVQTKQPFTFGCYGPDFNDKGEEKLVELETCRSLYDGCAKEKEIHKLKSKNGEIEYKYWCPCYDADGSNVGTKELAVFADATLVTTCTDYKSGGKASCGDGRSFS